MSWQILLLVAGCGALGCVARLLLATWTRDLTGDGYPYGTFVVNVLGCFLFGLCMGLGGGGWQRPVQAAVFTGFFGGFTTFSSFAFESSELLQQGRLLAAAAHVLGQNVLGIAGTALGIFLGRSLG